MAKCPKCGTKVTTPSKTWKYGHFTVEMFECACGTKFREYSKGSKHSFTLKVGKRRGLIKA